MKKLITAGIVLSLFGTYSSAQAQQEQVPATAADQIKNATEVTRQWVDTQATIAKEGNQWKVDRELIQQRIDLFQSEMENLQSEIDELAKKASEGQGTRAEYSNRIDELNRAQSVVLGKLPKYETELRELAQFFPAPLQNSISKLLNALPANPQKASSGPGQRLAVIVGILNEVDKFNKDVTTTQEIHVIDGKQIQVEVMYLGLGEAFYADENGMIGGYGTPAKGSWNWVEDNTMASQISKAIKIAQGKIKPAVFVELPMQVTDVK
jgi:chromosome segregation ATPase